MCDITDIPGKANGSEGISQAPSGSTTSKSHHQEADVQKSAENKTPCARLGARAEKGVKFPS